MTFLEQTSALRERVTNLDAVRANIAEVDVLQRRHNEAQQIHEDLSSIVRAADLLRNATVKLPPPPITVREARRRLEIIRERFAADAKASALTRGQDWEILIRNSKESAVAMRQQLQISWKSYVESLYTGDNPDNMAATIARTDKNDEVLGRYKSTFTQFQFQAQTFPKSREDIKEAQVIADRLKTIVREFDLNVPASVKRFLDAVYQNRAGLNLVTDEVVQWLKGNGTFDRYKIVAGRQ